MDFKILFSQLVTLYQKLTKQQKIIIAIAIIGIVSFLIFLVVFSSTKSGSNKYVTLFDSLSAEDAAKVVAQLEKDNIKYKLEENNVIKVPKNVVYKQRISIAALGIPKNRGVGFELFDTQEFGATSFDQKIKHLRALEGELTRTINALAPIENSSVHLAFPKDTLFVEKKSNPTASIMIQLIEGRRLTSRQVRGIKNLVSAAIPNMSSSDVMLIDGDGETLGDEDEMAQMGELSVVQQKFKNREEKKRKKKILEVVSPFVGGIKNVVAQVTIEYDFSIQNSTAETFDPESVVRSEQVNEEKREGSTPQQVGGVPGTVSNIGPVKGLKNNKITETYQKNTGTTNYEIGKTVRTTKSQFARIKRITAAVVVNGKYKKKIVEGEEENSELEYTPLDESDLLALSSLVSRSIGVNEARGDQISVKNLQFQLDKPSAAQNGVSEAISFIEIYLTPFSGIFKYIFVIILLLIVYKKVIVPFSARMLEISKEEDESERPSLEVDDDEEDDLVEKVQAMRKKVEDQLGIGKNVDEDELKFDIILDKVRGMAEDAPEDVASLLQALLVEAEDTDKE